ncbi:uncharacterized protein LOC134530698 [Bacillus rossius redtenbacheri]|uniref:uncharacterized protein LOC134530698 n=1 Tax=Bacillus rossius redtenbacheri TaxID=93214 RepID=UPI002FDEC311
MAVSKLPECVRSLLRTGIVVTTPAQTIVELVLNSIDAKATSISVRVDLQNFRLEVSDNGCGMNLKDIDRVGTRYMTSKCHSLQDLHNRLTHFGYRGEALASLRDATGFLTIESRPIGSDETYCKTFIRGKPYRAAVSEVQRQSFGTTVTAVEFMYNLPVRRKQIKEALDIEEIKYQLECIAVIHPQISFHLRNDVTSKTIMQSYRCSSIVQAFSCLFGEKIASYLAPVHHELSGYKLTGHISKHSHTLKHLQLVYVNRRLVRKTKIHRLVNTLLAKSYILRPNGPWKNSPISKNLTSAFWLTFPAREKRNKFAVFVLNIQCAHTNYDVSFEPKKTFIEFVDWDVVLKLIDEGVRKFLAQETIGLIDDSPSVSRGRDHQSQMSVMREMEDLEKESALASADIQNASSNDKDPTHIDADDRRKSLVTHGVSGLPARRRKLKCEQIIPQCAIPECSQEGSNSLKKFASQNVTSPEHLETFSENPFPTTSSLSDSAEQRTKNKGADRNAPAEINESFLPPPPKIPRTRFSNKILLMESTDSEDPISSTRWMRNSDRRYADGQKGKYVDAHKNLDMTKGKLKNFSFSLKKNNVCQERRISKNLVERHKMPILKGAKKTKVIGTLKNFSFCTPNNRHCAAQQSGEENTSMEAIASTQTNFSGDCHSGAEFSFSAPVSRRLSRTTTHKPLLLSKSSQTEEGFHEFETNKEGNFQSSVHKRDIGINAPCEILTPADTVLIEPKLNHNAVIKENSELISQKPSLTTDAPKKSLEFCNKVMIVNNSIADETTSRKCTDNLLKSCLKNNLHLEQSVCCKQAASKSVSFSRNSKCNITAYTVKLQSDDKRILLSKDDQQEAPYFQRAESQSSLLENKKFYMTSSDFLHTFKASEKISLSLFNCDSCGTGDILNNPAGIPVENNSNSNCDNISSFNEIYRKYLENNDNSSKQGRKLEMLASNGDSDSEARCKCSNILLHLHDDLRNKVCDTQKTKNIVEKKTTIYFSPIESGMLSRLSNQSESPICVVSVPVISSDDDSFCVDSEAGFNDMNSKKEEEFHSVAFSLEKCNKDTDTISDSSSLCGSSSSLADKFQMHKEINFCGSLSNAKGYENCSSRPGNKKINSPDDCSYDVRFDSSENCVSSKEDSIPCGQICVSPAKNLNAQNFGCDINAKVNGSLKLSSLYECKQYHKEPFTEICSLDFFCGARETVKSLCSCTCGTKEDNSNIHDTTKKLPYGISKEGDSYEKEVLRERKMSTKKQVLQLISSNIKILAPSSDSKMVVESSEGQCSESHCSESGTVQKSATVEGENCNTHQEIRDETSERSQGRQSITTSKYCREKVLVGNSSIDSSADVLTGPENGMESGAEVQISQTCNALYNACDSFDKEKDNTDIVAGEVPNADGDFLATSVSSQILIEVMDKAVQSMSDSTSDHSKNQLDCNRLYTDGQSASASEKNQSVQNTSNEKAAEKGNRPEDWSEAFDSSGKKYYMHTRSGITSYEAPVPTQEQATFKITKRYDFLPKGMSPILQLPTSRSCETACLASEQLEMLAEAVSEGGRLQNELTSVKWGTSEAEKPGVGSSCMDLVDQLMCSADRRMGFCEQDVPSTKLTEKNAIKVYNIMFPHLLTKDSLVAARVLRQVDKKLILAVTTMEKSAPPHLLVLFDQHAVHERIRVEKLFKDYRMEGSLTQFRSTDAEPNITMDLSAQEVRILTSFENEFHQAGLYYNVMNDTQIQVTKIPTCLHERENREAKRGTSVLKKFLESLIREQVDALIQTHGIPCSVPPTLRDIINSEACKGALKFGHELSTAECQMLVKHLALCDMPFHCAHGRPSVVTIADLNLINQQEQYERPRLWN